MIFYMPQKINIKPWLSISLFVVLCGHVPVKLKTREISTGNIINTYSRSTWIRKLPCIVTKGRCTL
jgi:hypothetical protein